jgi:hypothetical protein
LGELLEQQKDPDVLAEAIKAAGAGRERSLAGRVRALVGHERSRVFATAIRTLAVLDKDAARETATKMLESTDPRRRSSAIHTLAKVAPKKGLEALRAALASTDANARKAGLHALTLGRIPKPAEVALAHLVDEQDADLVEATASVIQNASDAPDPAGVRDAIAKLEATKTPLAKRKIELLRAFAGVSGEQAPPGLADQAAPGASLLAGLVQTTEVRLESLGLDELEALGAAPPAPRKAVTEASEASPAAPSSAAPAKAPHAAGAAPSSVVAQPAAAQAPEAPQARAVPGRPGSLPPEATWALIAVAAVAAIGMAAILAAPTPEPSPSPSPSAEEGYTVHALGRLGQKVTASGEVVSVDVGQNVLVVRLPDGTVLALAFPGADVIKELKAGQKVEVKGKIKRIEGPQLVVLSGESVTATP